MYRFTTPTHTFHFSTEVTEAREVLITYAQNGKIVLEKHKDELTISEDGKAASFMLTEDESALFSAFRPVSVQVRVLTSGGESLASAVQEVSVLPVLHDCCLGLGGAAE